MKFERKKILIMTDSPQIDTGFGRVGREVWSYLNSTGKYEILCIGWFHRENGKNIPYQVYSTRKDERGRITQQDKYAHESFPQMVDYFKPDLVWTLGDEWMVEHVSRAPNRNTFKWIGYFPIDGEPVPSKWGQAFDSMDIAVAYGEYGKKVAEQRTTRKDIRYIYHGVNARTFSPRPEQECEEAKRGILGLSENLVIGIVARNQPRKAFDCLFRAFYHIAFGEWYKCRDCGAITVSGYDIIERKPIKMEQCRKCLSNNMEKGSPNEDVKLYLHCAPKDCGWDLLDLQEDFNLRGKVLFNPELQIGKGVSDETLSRIYSAIDIFTLPTRGEGFGLPILEAMSCGKPVVATNYSAHTEWAQGASMLVDPKVLEAEPLTNIRRAVIDMDEYVSSLLVLIDSKEARESLGRKGRAAAERMDWPIILKQWEDLVDSVLFPEGPPEEVNFKDIKFSPEAI